jgi:hypothetical protein
MKLATGLIWTRTRRRLRSFKVAQGRLLEKAGIDRPSMYIPNYFKIEFSLLFQLGGRNERRERRPRVRKRSAPARRNKFKALCLYPSCLYSLSSMSDNLYPDLRDIVVRLDKQGVAVVALNRPAQRNAFTTGMKDSLVAAFGRLDEDDAVKVRSFVA